MASSLELDKYSHTVLDIAITHRPINSIKQPTKPTTSISRNTNSPTALRPQSLLIASTFVCIQLIKDEIKSFIIVIKISYIKTNGCPIATKRFITITIIINPKITLTMNPIRSGNTLYAINNNAHKPITSNILMSVSCVYAKQIAYCY